MAAPADLPTSPELVLVAPPEEAELARQSLPMPVPPIPRFPTFPPAPVRARARRAERSWTYAVAAAVVLAFAIAAAVVLSRSRAQPATTAARSPGTTPATTHPAPPAKPTKTATATTTASAPAKTTTTATATAPTTASAPAKTTTSAAPKGFVPSRVFAWPAKPDAVAYVIRFFRGSKLVFQRRTVQPRIELPESFKFAPGSYRWLVVPVDRRGDEGKAVVASQFDVG
jgi:hypothetical protein